MKNLLKFSLFESTGFDYVGLRTDKNYKEHIDFAFKGMARFNEEKDFPRWCIFKAYSMIILDEDLSQQTKDFIQDKLQEYYPEGFKTDFNFDSEIERGSTLLAKSVAWFLKNFLTEAIRGIKANGVMTMEAKKAFIDSIENSTKDTLTDLFLPGNLPNIQKLKYLDYLYNYTGDKVYLDSLGVDANVSHYITSGFNRFISLYSDGPERDNKAGEKLIALLKIFANHDMVYFKNLKLPDTMAEYVVRYFNLNKESFKTADDLRKSNIGIYNRIKELLPDIDTSADLGDLGF